MAIEMKTELIHDRIYIVFKFFFFYSLLFRRTHVLQMNRVVFLNEKKNVFSYFDVVKNLLTFLRYDSNVLLHKL